MYFAMYTYEKVLGLARRLVSLPSTPKQAQQGSGLHLRFSVERANLCKIA